MQQKILLVDDREDNLLSVEAILAPAGYQFVRANSGRQALKILLNQIDFVLILMDVKMPGLNGFETASMIYEREKLKHIPVIFITAHDGSEKNIYKGYRAGAVDYISKPINPELLRAKVAIFADLYQKNHRLMVQEERLKAINRSLENEINERKMSEEKIKELNRQLLENINSLEAANKDLDRFAFMASHDLQEPLRKIRTFSDMLLVKNGHLIHDDSRHCITRIQNAASRMQALITDIFTFSTVSSEKDEFSNCDLNALLQEVLSDMEMTIEEKKAHIEIEPLPLVPAKPGLVRLLFSNLIGNAVKYSKKGIPPIVKIRSEISTASNKGPEDGTDNKYCRIFVEDNGIGFEQKYAEQIFEMFKRLHINSEFEGTGIGLALCKKIVERHNGFISARSKTGFGSTFIVSLPLRQPVVKNRSAGKKGIAESIK